MTAITGDYRDLVVEARDPDRHSPGAENPRVRKRRALGHTLAEVGGILQGQRLEASEALQEPGLSRWRPGHPHDPAFSSQASVQQRN